MTDGRMAVGSAVVGSMAAAVAPGRESGRGVILADNDGLMRGVIRSVLVRVEQLVFPAADGVEAVALARQFRARLVMLDVAMPRLNGLLACEAIRGLPGYANVPIVMLTAYNDAPMRHAAKRLGANDFITKPFRPDELLQRLAAYLDLPAHLMPAAVGADGGLPGARVWQSRQADNPSAGDHPQLAEGRAFVDIYRRAEHRD
jgi:CheY-like chemotaxis protein